MSSRSLFQIFWPSVIRLLSPYVDELWCLTVILLEPTLAFILLMLNIFHGSWA